ncbi:MAG: divergent polysaccharide deacetylase family protein [Pseudomonadota bacterium]
MACVFLFAAGFGYGFAVSEALDRTTQENRASLNLSADSDEKRLAVLKEADALQPRDTFVSASDTPSASQTHGLFPTDQAHLSETAKALPASNRPHLSERPKIAFLIDDMGLDQARSMAMVRVPAPLTLSYLSYAPNLAHQTQRARELGHELMVHVPMEPISDYDPGPGALLTSHTSDDLLRNLRYALSRFRGYVGVNNHMGSRFTASAPHMGVVMSELQRRQLLFIDSRTTATTVGASVARARGVAFAERDIFLDHSEDPSAIWQAMSAIKKLAQQKGTAIAIGHPHDETREALLRWIPHLKSVGIDLVPISDVVAIRMRRKPEQTAAVHE